VTKKWGWQTLRGAKFCVSGKQTQFANLSEAEAVINKWNYESYKFSYILKNSRRQLFVTKLEDLGRKKKLYFLLIY
jgi:hypothetical protein